MLRGIAPQHRINDLVFDFDMAGGVAPVSRCNRHLDWRRND